MGWLRDYVRFGWWRAIVIVGALTLLGVESSWAFLTAGAMVDVLRQQQARTY